MRPSEQIQKLIDDSMDCGNAALIDAALEFVKAYEAKVDEVVAELRERARVNLGTCSEESDLDYAADLVVEKLGAK